MDNHSFEADGVPVRIFQPDIRAPLGAGIMFFHGGDWLDGSVEEYASDAQQLAKLAQMKVISVEFRKPPVHKYPAAFDDCLKATQYFMREGKTHDIDPKKILLAGETSGGNLALAVCLKLRDIHSTLPVMLVLIQPSLQMFDFSLPSYNLPEYSNMDKQSMIYSWLMYGFGKKDKYSHFVRNSHVTLEARQRYKKLLDFDTLDKKYYDQDYKRPDPPAGDDGVWNAIKELVLDPYFAPGMADNLSSIPETYIMTAGRDPLRDEGVIFAQRLVDSGVAGVGHEHHQDMVHGQAFQHTDAIKSMATLIHGTVWPFPY